MESLFKMFDHLIMLERIATISFGVIMIVALTIALMPKR